jgi:hypothetical protein
LREVSGAMLGLSGKT